MFRFAFAIETNTFGKNGEYFFIPLGVLVVLVVIKERDLWNNLSCCCDVWWW